MACTENRIRKTIRLRCINCGREFEQEVTVKSEDALEKEIEWYKKNQKHCQRCRMARMGHGGGQGAV